MEAECAAPTARLQRLLVLQLYAETEHTVLANLEAVHALIMVAYLDGYNVFKVRMGVLYER